MDQMGRLLYTFSEIASIGYGVLPEYTYPFSGEAPMTPRLLSAGQELRLCASPSGKGGAEHQINSGGCVNGGLLISVF